MPDCIALKPFHTVFVFFLELIAVRRRKYCFNCISIFKLEGQNPFGSGDAPSLQQDSNAMKKFIAKLNEVLCRKKTFRNDTGVA